jgi:hypothetical protein
VFDLGALESLEPFGAPLLKSHVRYRLVRALVLRGLDPRQGALSRAADLPHPFAVQHLPVADDHVEGRAAVAAVEIPNRRPGLPGRASTPMSCLNTCHVRAPLCIYKQ